jgi:hypothetical protein
VLDEWREIKAPRMSEILREHGYEGSADLVKRHLRRLRQRQKTLQGAARESTGIGVALQRLSPLCLRRVGRPVAPAARAVM